MRRWTPAVAGAVLALATMGLTASAAYADGHAGSTTGSTTRADWSAGAVQRGTGYRTPGGSRRVRELQRRLQRSGLDPGPIDGLYGPRTERAVRRFQARRELTADAIVGPRTLHVLRTTTRLGRATQPVVTTRTAPPPLPTALPAPRAAPAAMPATPALPVGALIAVLAVLGLGAVIGGYVRTGGRIRPREPAR
jgi:peptidoglycan hydrolase-like protein with peptidoglycan-binding domain